MQSGTSFPTKENMAIVQNMVKIVENIDKWKRHPNKQKKDRKVNNRSCFYNQITPEQDVTSIYV